MAYSYTIGGATYKFADLKQLLACATPYRSGDVLAGVAAKSAQERAAAQFALADTTLVDFLENPLIPYEVDEITRLIVDTQSPAAFAPVSHMTVGSFRDWLLSPSATPEAIRALGPGLTPEMVAATSKVMRLQDLILVGQKCRVITKFRNTLGSENRMSTRLQPNHPTDDLRGIAASLLDGLLLGAGDAVIGVNPATDSVESYVHIVEMLDSFRRQFNMPGQSCVLAHVTTAMKAMEAGAPVDIVFQSIAGTQEANRGFGIDLQMLTDAHQMALELNRGTLGSNVMYFETGQGSALSSNSHHGIDQQTVEARAYAVARRYSPLLVNTVVGFIGPEYLFDGKQIIRAGLEDHFCAKLLGLPMGCDVCYTNHAEADQDDMDSLLTLLCVAGCTFIMGVPGADDIMLNYQSTSFHDALYVRHVLRKRPAPEFEAWLYEMGLFDRVGGRRPLLGLTAIDNPLVKALTHSFETRGLAVSAPASVWSNLKRFTSARIGIEPTGVSQPTSSTLRFQWDHAEARDAVYSSLDIAGLAALAASLGFRLLAVNSEATERSSYLQFPNRGRRLNEVSVALLKTEAVGWDVVFVLADGLSARAVQAHAIDLVSTTVRLLQGDHWSIAPIIIVNQGRVAVGDHIAELLDAKMVVVLIGERPGLCTADSLGAYLTWRPCEKSVDSERNCISNIRPGGLVVAAASTQLASLMTSIRGQQLSGVGLKSDDAVSLPSKFETLLIM